MSSGTVKGLSDAYSMAIERGRIFRSFEVSVARSLDRLDNTLVDPEEFFQDAAESAERRVTLHSVSEKDGNFTGDPCKILSSPYGPEGRIRLQPTRTDGHRTYWIKSNLGEKHYVVEISSAEEVEPAPIVEARR
ncbi:hypothetical protein CMI45_02975 [Candidatus Pacearchaeota archaeon]|nr:hypothetical protein [Candidatus Pacearchaeota archaeon]MAG38322.1 hypothetical protein [Candidatus Pacearchaeota archaeon]|tara:strand:+ start:254 stop:655 length:402 start_codon:yes stop_codon:yes gene_type:complete